MSQTEYRNMKAKCLDMNSPDAVVLHDVEFEIKESGGDWKPHSITIMATDPQDAINAVRRTT